MAHLCFATSERSFLSFGRGGKAFGLGEASAVTSPALLGDSRASCEEDECESEKAHYHTKAMDDTEYTLVASGIADGEVLEVASDLFSVQDYVVDGVSFRVSGGSVVAEVRVYRDNRGMKFVRAVFPMIMNAGLVGFAGSTKGHARVKYLALSLLAAIFMLDGAKLGLPPGLGGVPFVMSLVIVHIVIAAAVLAISIVEAENNYRLQKKVMKGGKWKEVIAARTRWEHANALLAPHREKAFAAAGIELDPAHWPAQLGSHRNREESIRTGTSGNFKAGMLGNPTWAAIGTGRHP